MFGMSAVDAYASEVTEVTAQLLAAGEVILMVIAIAGAIAAVAVVRLTQKRADEWKELAEARAAQVEDLKEKVAELRLDFSKQISELRGAVSAMESLKSEQIAQKVSDAISADEIARKVVDLMGDSALHWNEH